MLLPQVRRPDPMRLRHSSASACSPLSRRSGGPRRRAASDPTVMSRGSTIAGKTPSCLAVACDQRNGGVDVHAQPTLRPPFAAEKTFRSRSVCPCPAKPGEPDDLALVRNELRPPAPGRSERARRSSPRMELPSRVARASLPVPAPHGGDKSNPGGTASGPVGNETLPSRMTTMRSHSPKLPREYGRSGCTRSPPLMCGAHRRAVGLPYAHPATDVGSSRMTIRTGSSVTVKARATSSICRRPMRRSWH